MKYILIALLIGATLFFSIKYLSFSPKKLVNGESVPELTGILRNGKTFDLKELRGHYVLLDFWGSWCAPCIEEMPKICALNYKFRTKAFCDAHGFVNIVSFGIEDDSTRWGAAIDRLKMNWEYQIADFKNMQSPIVKSFGITKVPTKFLIDPKGVIVGVNMSPEEIEKYLDEENMKF